jgi:hypothetical protein
MFPQLPTPLRIATSPGRRTPGVGLHDQREARRFWLMKLFSPSVKLIGTASTTQPRYCLGTLAQ